MDSGEREGRKENGREGKGKKENEKKETIEIKLLNVQRLTEDKWIEILEETGDDSIMPNGNTKKVDDIKIVKDVMIIQTMREMQDRRGGGLLIMYKEKEKYDLQKMTTRSTEILHVEGEIGKEQIMIVLVYMKTGNDNETKEHNKKIIEEIGQIVEETEIQQKATIVLGDFNGHLGYLGNQEENMNGKLINKMIQEDLILLNIDSRCKGTYTWQREQKVQ